jgi:hypothetical protein
MDKETKTFLLALGLGIVILLVTRPKKATDKKPIEKFASPKEADSTLQKQKEDSIIALQAMRDAINNKETPEALNKLKDMIFKEYGLKVMINKSTKKLRALDKSGKLIAEEE